LQNNSETRVLPYKTLLFIGQKGQIPKSYLFVITNNCIEQEIAKLIRHGLGVRIAGSHPAGPGSIPGAGINLFVFF
jgi:hypothetical protein